MSQWSLTVKLILCVLILAGITVWYLRERKIRRDIYDFADNLDKCMDEMIQGEENIIFDETNETLLSRLQVKLKRLYEIQKQYSRQSEEERKKLQTLISDISHQTKTPVANMKMYVEILKDREIPDSQREEFLSRVEEQTKKLDFLIQSMIKMSRLEAGIFTLEKKQSSFYETLGRALADTWPKASKKGIDVEVDCPEDLILSHDSKWTQEALFNILENAVKYTGEKGQIEVAVTVQELFVKTVIKDDGIGIDESELGSIFGRFIRGSEVHDEEGVGIGLYLAREIITKQQGYIEVHSWKGEGSEFCIYLPKE